MDRQVVDDPFVKYLLENLHGEGKIFLQNLINCNENLETLTKLIPLLMSDINFYRKDCLIPMIVEKSIEICSKFEKKRKLDELRERAKELSEATDKEKTQYERSLAYRNKEIDFSRKCENSQLFYENKMSEYYKQIKQLENLLVNVGFYDELSEQSIKALEQDNNLLKDQIKEINDKLTYYTFQPDEESLKKNIESLRNEIEIMNEDLERVIEEFNVTKVQEQQSVYFGFISKQRLICVVLKMNQDHSLSLMDSISNYIRSSGLPNLRGYQESHSDQIRLNKDSLLRNLFKESITKKVPLVFHNELIDLIFIYHNFLTSLSPKLTSFVVDLDKLFPKGVFDTKNMDFALKI